jgi:hypothetical protein
MPAFFGSTGQACPQADAGSSQRCVRWNSAVTDAIRRAVTAALGGSQRRVQGSPHNSNVS